MDSDRARPGHLIAGAAGLLLLISMLFDWYGARVSIGGATGGGGNAFDSPGFLGGIADLIIFGCAIVGIGFLLTSASGSKLELPMAPSALTALAGATAAGLIFLRMIFQPGPNQDATLEFGIFFAFLMAIGIAVGGYLAMQDEGATFDRTGEPPA